MLSSARNEVLQQENARLSATVSDLGKRIAAATGQLQSTLGRFKKLQQQPHWFKPQDGAADEHGLRSDLNRNNNRDPPLQ